MAQLLQNIKMGITSSLVLMTNGVDSRPETLNHRMLRYDAQQNAMDILGFERLYQADFPDNAMDTVPLLDVAKFIESAIKKEKPSTIFTHFHGDLNIDHKITASAVAVAVRPIPNQTVKKIVGIEVPSSTDWILPDQISFSPNLFVDVTNEIDIKIRAPEAYNLEMRDPPHFRSLEHCLTLASHRGNMVGLHKAEAFFVYRIVE